MGCGPSMEKKSDGTLAENWNPSKDDKQRRAARNDRP
jgi:hypothetical protein